jgi:ABC-2 type transport system ATP-binding protein
VARLRLDNDPQAARLDSLPGVEVRAQREDYIEMHLQADLNPDVIVQAALAHGGRITRFELVEPR